MKFTVKVGQLEKFQTECLILPVYENRKLSEGGQTIDGMLNKSLTQLMRQGNCSGTKGQVFLYCPEKNSLASRFCLVGVGVAKQLTEGSFKDIFNKALASMTQSGITDIAIPLEEFGSFRTNEWKIRQIIQLIADAHYSFDTLKSQKKTTPPKALNWSFLISSKKELQAAQQAVEEGLAITLGMELMKDLANLPPNLCTPSYLAEEAKRFAKKHAKTSVAILEKKELESLKMGSLLSVAQGSNHPPKFITLSYKGAKKSQKPIVLVGKGITFDTGGNSLKPAANMIGMKYDMSGAASIYGVFKAVEKLELPINLIGVIPACENMPGPYASRPDDVVTSMSGQTIEILNTDAEGRLILADALTYCERFEPAAVIDIATLTGACIIALGHYYSGLMGNDVKLKRQLLEASDKANDPIWELPLGESYEQSLQSEVADFANIAGPDTGAGTIVAGCFLSKFTKKYPWAHLDIAGTACFYTGPKRGSSGRPVPLLVQYLIDYSNSI